MAWLYWMTWQAQKPLKLGVQLKLGAMLWVVLV
jgi:hypothetical protein